MESASRFHTPYGVTVFATMDPQDYVQIREHMFPYALWRDCVCNRI